MKMEVWILCEYHVNWSSEKKRKIGCRVRDVGTK